MISLFQDFLFRSGTGIHPPVQLLFRRVVLGVELLLGKCGVPLRRTYLAIILYSAGTSLFCRVGTNVEPPRTHPVIMAVSVWHRATFDFLLVVLCFLICLQWAGDGSNFLLATVSLLVLQLKKL